MNIVFVVGAAQERHYHLYRFFTILHVYITKKKKQSTTVHLFEIMKFSFDFSALRLSYALSCFLLLSCCVRANPVETMRDLLSCSGWEAMASSDLQIEIIDRRWADRPNIRKLTVFNLLAPPVNEENVTGKIQEAHQFLSCSYARVLTDLCDYEKGIGLQCRSITAVPEAFKCLQDYRQAIRYKHPAVSRMIGALGALQQLASPQPHFEMGLFNILGDLQQFYQQRRMTAVGPPPGEYCRAAIDAESEVIEQHAGVMYKRLFAFYNRYCWPVSYWIRSSGLSKPTEDIRWLERVTFRDRPYVAGKIKDQLITIIRDFMESHEATSGFEYDPQSNATRITRYDANTVERVAKTNLLLGNTDYWKSFKPLEIKENDQLTTVDDLLWPAGRPTLVTKENLCAKLKRAHQLLNCQYSWILVECCHHVAGMWTDCQKSQDPVCLEYFLQVLNEADPSVLRMIDGLSYVHRLSPDTCVYDKSVFDLLKLFKHFYDQRTGLTDRDVTSWSPAVVRDISEIAQNSAVFFQKFCRSNFEIDSYSVSAEEMNRTIDVKGEIFKNRILNLTYSYDVFV